MKKSQNEKATYNELRAENERLRNENIQLKEQLENTLCITCGRPFCKNHENMEQLCLENARLKEESQNEKATYNELRAENERLRNENIQLKEQLENTLCITCGRPFCKNHENMEQLCLENARLKEESQNEKATYNELRAENERLRNENIQLKEQLENTLCITCGRPFCKNHENMEQLCLENARLKEESQNEKATYNELRAENERLRNENIQLKEQLENTLCITCGRPFCKNHENMEQLCLENARLKEESQNEKATYNELRAENERLRNENIQLKEQLENTLCITCGRPFCKNHENMEQLCLENARLKEEVVRDPALELLVLKKKW
ncbi:putative golgin subfamily A member 6-like protein 3 [Trifolium pratense]|uniref:putative golgin subfamily A member 6-like protein 3 n=1 Tax=Trifolium pratense TaxID=57577 RepID=UPI001E6920FC|nr:putative golgin subfamily A member 6-like protein 3 [Trifolium pratense]